MRHVFLILAVALASTAAGQTFVPDPVEGADLFNPTSLDWDRMAGFTSLNSTE